MVDFFYSPLKGTFPLLTSLVVSDNVNQVVGVSALCSVLYIYLGVYPFGYNTPNNKSDENYFIKHS